MKLFGTNNDPKIDEEISGLLQLREVTISASPHEIRKISLFINDCLRSIENNEGSDHFHFIDSDHSCGSDFDLIFYVN